jgi:hypothetical protein
MMATDVATGRSITISGTDLSDHLRIAEVTMESQMLDQTAMGAIAENGVPGIRKDKIVATFIQDFAASKVDATLSSLVGSSAGATIVVKPTSASVSATNPSYTMVGTIDGEYSPVGGEVNSVNLVQVTFSPVNGTGITRATS